VRTGIPFALVCLFVVLEGEEREAGEGRRRRTHLSPIGDRFCESVVAWISHRRSVLQEYVAWVSDD